MGAAASIEGGVGSFTDHQKAAIMRALKDNIDNIKTDDDELSAFQSLSVAVGHALKDAEAGRSPRDSTENVEAEIAKLTRLASKEASLISSLVNLDEESPELPRYARAKSEMLNVQVTATVRDGGEGKPLPNTREDFRARRLTIAKKDSEPLTEASTEEESGRISASSERQVYKAGEIGEGKEALLPFLDSTIGTYSCHGVEPDWYSADGTAAKINQDRGVVVFPYGGDARKALFAVFDGHGERGQTVSQFCMTEVQVRLEQHPRFLDDVATAMKDTFVEVDAALSTCGGEVEPVYSGTTAVVVLMHERRLHVANAGDSRATVGRREGGELKARDLSIDQNPNSPEERKRIEGLGGFVSEPPEEGLSSRVWLDSAMTQIGLAMSRSLGDHAVKAIGVIPEPVVLEHDLDDADEFMVIASDGVWEFIKSEEAVQIVGEYIGDLGASRACEILINIAAARWQEEEGDYRDDITAVVVKLPCLDSVVPVKE